MKEPEEKDGGWALISCYTRKQAITDGVLVDVSEMAREAGFRYPVALSAAVWAKYVEVPTEVAWQDEKGRLWDILMMLRFTIGQAREVSVVQFKVSVMNRRHCRQTVLLKAVCGPGDEAEPVITVMLPEED